MSRHSTKTSVLSAIVLGAGVLAACVSSTPPLSVTGGSDVSVAAHELSVSDLRINATRSPLGLDDPRPMLAWTLASRERGAAQTGYQIQVASSAENLARGRADVWDSGRVDSAAPRARYAGAPLEARKRYHVRLRVWDERGRRRAWSAPTHWEMGLMAPTDWRARWIRAGGVTTIDAAYQGHYFRRAFDLPADIASARLYFAGWGMMRHCLNRTTPQACRVAAGLVIPTINGRRLSDRQLDSAPSDAARALYTTLDVTAMLQPGRNVIGLSVGGDSDVIAQLEVMLRDGRTLIVSTDREWTTRPSASTYIDRFAGVRHDARLEPLGWDTPEFRPDAEWVLVQDSTEMIGSITLSSDSTLPPMRIVRRVDPVSIAETSPGVFTLDFGENITGRVHFNVRNSEGRTLSVTHAERLNSRSEADRHSTGFFGLQTDHYTFADRQGDWAPEFSYYGFRYATVRGLSAPPQPGQIWAEQVNTDLEVAGGFESSNELVNRIHAGSLLTTLNNTHGIPEDCPHREKRGWSMDAVVSAPQAFANFAMQGFYEKWLRDVRDAQRPSGAGTNIAPVEVSYAEDGDSTWSSVLVFLPRDLYRHTGDLEVLRASYDSMRRLADWQTSLAEDYILPRGTYIGDWVPARQTNDALLRTAIWYAVVREVEDTARLLGIDADAERFRILGDAIKEKFNATFLDRATATYGAAGSQNDTTSQASMGVPLSFGLVPDDMRDRVAARLADYIENVSERHPESGLTATRFTLEGLRSIDRPDLLHAMINQTDFPSWGFMVNSGPGTMWESWNGRGSLNHAWPGVIDAHFYSMYAGIQPTSPGFSTLDIRPFVPDDMDWVRAWQTTPYGRVASAWRKENGRLTLDVEVPPGVRARIMVPVRQGLSSVTLDGAAPSRVRSVRALGLDAGYAVYEIGSGRYSFASTGW